MDYKNTVTLLQRLKNDPHFLKAFNEDVPRALSQLSIQLEPVELELWEKMMAKLKSPEKTKNLTGVLLGA